MILAWTVVVPVKALDAAKSRLAAGERTAALALAFATDTVAAAAAAPGVAAVVVVTSDREVLERMSALGAAPVPDPGAGLNRAIVAGIAAAPTDAVAVLTGDLPGLRPEDLGAALAQAAGHPLSCVPDTEGSGTTMIAARSVAATGLRPAFGVGSRAAHEALGHVGLEFPAASGLRCDVDTPHDLRAALQRGVGAATAIAAGVSSS